MADVLMVITGGEGLLRRLDRFVEARRKVSKTRALKPVQAGIENALEKGWKAQSALVLNGFESLRKSWPVMESMPAWEENLTPAGLRPAGKYRISQHWLRESIEGGDLDSVFEKAAKKTLKLFLDPLAAAAGAALESGALALVGRLGIAYAFDLKNPRAVAYLKTAEMLVKQLNETTKEDLRTTVLYGLENGWSYQKTARSLQERFKGYYDPGSWWNFDSPRPQGHIDSRAHLVAVTESGNAYEAGNYLVVEDLADAGIQVEKKWSTIGDDRVSEGCLENEAEGWIPADQPHKSGDLHPLRFPGCRCDEYYQVKEA